MILDLLRGGNYVELMVSLLSRAFVVFLTLPMHEYAHAYVATKLGDPTPRLSGRLTLNPMKHLDPIGTLLIFVAGFGYAKPVPVNPRNFKDGKRGMALTALAGPVMNLLMALVFLLLMYLCVVLQGGANLLDVMRMSGGYGVQSLALSDPSFLAIASLFLFYAAQVNVSLAVFNLLPIPPLDGSRILSLFLPDKYYFKIMKYERYIMLVVFALLIFGVLSRPLGWLVSWAMYGLNYLASLPFLFFG